MNSTEFVRTTFPLLAALAAVGALGVRAVAQGSARPIFDRLIGYWHVVAMDEEGPDGTMIHHTERIGMFVFSADRSFSEQVMYPVSEGGTTANAAYQRDGYEATFARFEVDEATHSITQHAQGALV